MVHAEPLQAFSQARSVVEALTVVPKFGGEEDLLAFQARGADPLPDAVLVVVDGGGVDIRYPASGRLDGGYCGVVRGLPDAEAYLRNGLAVIEGNACLLCYTGCLRHCLQ